MMRCLQTIAFLFISFFLSFSAYAGYSSHTEYDDEQYKNWLEYYGVEFNDQDKSDLYFKAFVSFEDVMGDFITENLIEAGGFPGRFQFSFRLKPKKNFSNTITDFVAGKKPVISKNNIPEQCRPEKDVGKRLQCYQNILDNYIEEYIFEDYPVTSEHYDNNGDGYMPGIGIWVDRYYNRKPRVRKSLAIAQDDFYNLMEALTDKEEDIKALTEWYYLELIAFFQKIVEIEKLDDFKEYLDKRKALKL